MPNTIATWIYLEPAGQESQYLQMQGSSSSKRFQATYWKCVCTFFATSLRQNPDARHILFTNAPPEAFPQWRQFSVRTFLEGLGVLIQEVSLQHLPPAGYYNAWRNQFYVFDILRNWVSQGTNAKGKILLLDSDCLWIRPATSIWRLMDQASWPTYAIPYAPDHQINGLSRQDMQGIFEELAGEPLSTLPAYHAGEVVAATGAALDRLLPHFDHLWPLLMDRHARGLAKLNEEAHVLSYLHYRLKAKGEGLLNPFIKRIWTLEKLHSNVEPEDCALTVWHLPGEKQTGISLIFERVKNPASRFWHVPPEKLGAYLGPFVGIPSRKHKTEKLVLSLKTKLLASF